jgi:lysophospholipase L1-like esterase
MTAGAKRTLFRGTALIFSLAFAGLFGELACALFCASPSVRTDILGRKILDRPRMPVRQLPNGEGSTYGDLVPGVGHDRLLNDYNYEYRVNSLGLRNRELEPKAAGAFRILTLGDSQTFGFGVVQEKTFSVGLEDQLHAKGFAHVEVINGGTPGYGTDEISWKLRRVAPLVKPDLILFVNNVDNALIYDESNDIYNNYVRMLKEEATRGGPTPEALRPQRAKAAFLANHSHLYALLSAIKRKLRHETHAELIRAYRTRPDGGDLARVWDRTRGLLRKADRAAQESGARLVLVHLPGLASIEANDRTGLAELEATGLPVISLFDPLLAASRGNFMSLRFPHDAHYNTEAHAEIARALADALIQRGLLGKPAAPDAPTTAQR